MSFKNPVRMILLPILLIQLSACDVVKLDSKGKPIIPMTAQEAASLKNMTPKAIVEKLWSHVIRDANKKSMAPAQALRQEGTSEFIKFSGVVSGLETTKYTTTLRINSDGKQIDLQVGAIIRGNAIRDATSFIKFGQFKNQVQYARLSKELNKKAMASIESPKASWTGKKVDVIAAVTIKHQQMTLAVPLILSKR